tara:strand:- start:299 stop:838 length:540 start_codon:yes stop_codon:yes gene_type:complete
MFWFQSEKSTQHSTGKTSCDNDPSTTQTDGITEHTTGGKIWTITINKHLHGYLKNESDVDSLISKLHITACSDLDPTSELVLTHNNTKTRFQIQQKYKNTIIGYTLRCIYDVEIRECDELDIYEEFDGSSEASQDDQDEEHAQNQALHGNCGVIENNSTCDDTEADMQDDAQFPEDNRF